jgi:nucleotide-binding universal stress UspA family protein
VIILALLNRPEDLQSNLVMLKEIVKAQGAFKMFLARVLRPFRPRVKSVAAPHKLESAGQISDELANTYTSFLVNEFRLSGIEVEIIRPGLTASEIRNFVADRGIDLVVTISNKSSPCKWPGKELAQNQLQTICEAVSAW